MAKMASLHEEVTRPTTIMISEDQWIDSYAPITHSPLDEVQGWIPVFNVWTVVDTDDKLYIVNGFHSVNKIGYHITEQRWKHGQDIEVKVGE